jgi:hypothetical protein
VFVVACGLKTPDETRELIAALQESLMEAEGSPDEQQVGSGPAYGPILSAAKALLPLFAPSGYTLSASWGACLIETLRPSESVPGEHEARIIHPVCTRWQQDRNSLLRRCTLDDLRATGIALLAYAEHQKRCQAAGDLGSEL